MFESFREYQPQIVSPQPGGEIPPVDIIRHGGNPNTFNDDPQVPLIVASENRRSQEREPHPGSSFEAGEEGGALPATLPSGAETDPPLRPAGIEITDRGEPPSPECTTAPLEIETAYVHAEAGIVRPRDPLTLKVLEPGEIPPSLLADEGLRSGYEYLREHGDKVHLTVLRMRHGETDTLERYQVGFDLQAEARSLREKGGVLYVETVAIPHMKKVMRGLYNAAANVPPEKIATMQAALRELARDEPGMAFGTVVAEGVLATGVTAEPIDFMLDGDRPADAVLTGLRRWLKAAQREVNQSKSAESYVKYLWEKFGFDTYRDAYQLGGMGEDMAERFGPSPTAIHAGLLVGGHHENVGHRARTMGAELTILGRPPLWRSGDSHYVRCLGRGMLTPEDVLRTLEP